jgi:hypothetical protein
MEVGMGFIKAKVGPPNIGDKDVLFTVQYFDEEGNMTIRSYGTRAWRCNNPGALLVSPYSTGKDRHSIGTAGFGKYFYAVYPDYDTGHEALIVMLKGSKYFHLTLREASERYVKEDPDHIHKIVKLSKLSPDRTIGSLSSEEFEIYWKSIETNESWKVGREDPIPKQFITGVHRKRGVICEYRIDQDGKEVWLAKNDAILLAEAGRLHAVVVHLKNGSCYLRLSTGQKNYCTMIHHRDNPPQRWGCPTPQKGYLLGEREGLPRLCGRLSLWCYFFLSSTEHFFFK